MYTVNASRAYPHTPGAAWWPPVQAYPHTLLSTTYHTWYITVTVQRNGHRRAALRARSIAPPPGKYRNFAWAAHRVSISISTRKWPSRVSNRQKFRLRGAKAGGSAPLHPPRSRTLSSNVRTRRGRPPVSPPWTYNTTSLAQTIILLHRTTSKAGIACPRAHSAQITSSWQAKVPPQTLYPRENPLHPTVKRPSTSDRFASSRRFETVCGTSWSSLRNCF